MTAIFKSESHLPEKGYNQCINLIHMILDYFKINANIILTQENKTKYIHLTRSFLQLPPSALTF